MNAGNRISLRGRRVYNSVKLNVINGLSGIENINSGSIEDLEIDHNYLLAECDVQSICNYLAGPNGTLEIHDNANSCNSQEEVEEACGLGIGEVASRQSTDN